MERDSCSSTSSFSVNRSSSNIRKRKRKIAMAEMSDKDYTNLALDLMLSVLKTRSDPPNYKLIAMILGATAYHFGRQPSKSDLKNEEVVRMIDFIPRMLRNFFEALQLDNLTFNVEKRTFYNKKKRRCDAKDIKEKHEFVIKNFHSLQLTYPDLIDGKYIQKYAGKEQVSPAPTATTSSGMSAGTQKDVNEKLLAREAALEDFHRIVPPTEFRVRANGYPYFMKPEFVEKFSKWSAEEKFRWILSLATSESPRNEKRHLDTADPVGNEQSNRRNQKRCFTTADAFESVLFNG